MKSSVRQFFCVTLLFLTVCSASAQVAVKLGTMLPKDTSYYTALLKMGQKWREASGGAVTLTVYPGGAQGGEADVVRKIRAGQLTAGMLSAVGLSDIDKSVTCLQYMPLVFRSWEELDYVRDRIAPKLEKLLLDKGLVTLFWGDAGWVRFFSKTPFQRPSDLKKMKIFTWTGDTYQFDLMKNMGYQPIALETNDILPSLKTGMIEVVSYPPYLAEFGQIDRAAPNMLDLNWAPMVGATVIKKEVWEKFPAQGRDAAVKSAQAAGEEIRQASRKENEASVAAMRKRGLQVQSVTTEIENEWRQFAEAVYPSIRGRMVPADMFDEVLQLLKEYRGSKGVK
jgi:TRAP-type C4-dicarboxylate transport system substrate-binding protein